MLRLPEQGCNWKGVWWLIGLIEQSHEAKEACAVTWVLMYQNHCPYWKPQNVVCDRNVCYSLSFDMSPLCDLGWEMAFLALGTLQLLGSKIPWNWDADTGRTSQTIPDCSLGSKKSWIKCSSPEQPWITFLSCCNLKQHLLFLFPCLTSNHFPFKSGFPSLLGLWLLCLPCCILTASISISFCTGGPTSVLMNESPGGSHPFL